MVPVYYCPVQPSNTISSGDLKFYAGFQKVASENFEHCDIIDPQGHSWISPYITQNNLDHVQFENFKVNPQVNNYIVIPTLCDPSKINLSQLINQNFDNVSIDRQKKLAIKGLMEGLTTNITDLE